VEIREVAGHVGNWPATTNRAMVAITLPDVAKGCTPDIRSLGAGVVVDTGPEHGPPLADRFFNTPAGCPAKSAFWLSNIW
jgi:hypothetical protein